MGHIIEPERIEYVLCNCDIVSHVFIYGDWEHASLVAVVVLDPEFLKVFLSKKNILKEGSEPPHHQMLCIDTVVKDVAIIGLIRDGVKRSLSYYDPVSNVYLEPYDAIRHHQAAINRLHEEIGSDVLMKFSFLSLLTSFGPLPAVPPPSLTTPAPTATGIEGPAHHNIETWDPA
ncbi:Long-chain-fatty-acid--CoA ligase 1 [Coemansia sp. RSA 922]|nr:Long-chain-fatty-acid--CoA ligase 1 [Coemansia sp. RSA 922]